MIRTLISSFNFAVSLTLYMAITFIMFVRTGGVLTPRRVIVTLSLLGFLRTVSATFLIRAIFLLFEARVALTRIQVNTVDGFVSEGYSELHYPKNCQVNDMLK